MDFCGNCGAPIPEGNRFCEKCGAPVNSQPGNNNQYGYQNQTRQPGGYRANIKKRDIVTAVILSIVTCGIYSLIWFVNIVNDLNTAANTPEDKSAGMIILLTIITCGIYMFIWCYQAGDKVDKVRQMNGEAPAGNAVLYLVLALITGGIVTQCLIQSELNKVAMDA